MLAAFLGNHGNGFAQGFVVAAQNQLKLALAAPEVPALAGAELHEAEISLDQARTAWAAQAKPSDVDHFAYLASKKIAIARMAANQRLAEKAIDGAQGQRQQTQTQPAQENVGFRHIKPY